MLEFWRDSLERQLAALDGAIGALKAQIERDSSQKAESSSMS